MCLDTGKKVKNFLYRICLVYKGKGNDECAFLYLCPYLNFLYRVVFEFWNLILKRLRVF